MNIKYVFPNSYYNFEQDNKEHLENLSFLLTNQKGDFLINGIEKNSTKYQGFNICDSKTQEIFKIIDEIIPKGLEVDSVEYNGYEVKRIFKSKFTESLVEVEGEKSTEIKNDSIITSDKFYLGQNGGFIYHISNFEGKILVNLDMRGANDFDKWGRDYKIKSENGIIFVEYTKKSDDNSEYKLYLGIKASNFLCDLVENWEERTYSYSKKRGSLDTLYIYNLLNAKINGNKKIIFGAGFSKEEVVSQINLLEFHEDELTGLDFEKQEELIDKHEFNKPILEEANIAYKLSVNSIYNLYKSNLKNKGFFAGFPWFSQVWSRDDLVSLRSLINLGENNLVKERLFNYLKHINENTGEIKRIETNDSLSSPDAVFWLAKRIEDFIFELDSNNKLEEVLNLGEIKYIFDKLSVAFNNIITTYWDSNQELLKVKKGDSWMDTIDVEFPIDIQVQLLEFASSLSVLATIYDNKEDAKKFEDFEELLRIRIRTGYFRNGKLYCELNSDLINSNIFLAYYLYPDLLLQKDWENVIDYALKELRTIWGGISSVSKNHSNFKEEYSGENNLSYHMGDVWFWINNIAAICMYDLNEKKYRTNITKILSSSTRDILKFGAIGYSSEISSSINQKSEGCFAQTWSTATYIEMIDKLFEK